jgi:hypothetical protein
MNFNPRAFHLHHMKNLELDNALRLLRRPIATRCWIIGPCVAPGNRRLHHS